MTNDGTFTPSWNEKIFTVEHPDTYGRRFQPKFLTFVLCCSFPVA